MMIYLSAIESEEDKDLFERLYKENRQDMYAVAYAVLHKREDAEDAVHQSFLKIADKLTKISQMPCHERRAYIVMISRNTAINMYQGNKRRAQHSETLSDAEDHIADYPQDRYIELVEAIKSLPQMYKDVLFLYCLQGFSAKETAKMLGIKTENVRQRAGRAKQMLSEILREE